MHALFPGFVRHHRVELGGDNELDARARFADIPLPPEVQRAVPRRQAEFLAGRFCARRALAALEPACAHAAIGIGRQREPLWPAGFVGSITHAPTSAAAAVARRQDAAGIGFDIEELVDDETAGRMREFIATEDELAALSKNAGEDVALLITAVFSAKEAVFKCLFPSVGKYFDFLDARVMAVDLAAGRFDVELRVSLSDRLRAGYVLQGRLVCAATTIVTALVLAP